MVFPERGEKIACDFGNLPVYTLGNYSWAYILVKYLREHKKNFEKLDMPPHCILFIRWKIFLITSARDFDRKILSIFPLILNQNPEQCMKEKFKEIGSILQ